MTARYFDGLTFRFHLETPACTAWCRKRFAYFVLDYSHAGRVSFSMDGSRPVLFEGPMAWWTWPGPHYSFGARPGEKWHHHFVSFEGPRAQRMLRTGLLPARAQPWVRPERPEEFRSRMLELFGCLEAPRPDSEHATHLLEGLLLELHRPAQTDGPPAASAAEELAAAMRRSPGDAPDPVRWAERAGVSLVHFRRSFRRRFGMPPVRFLQALRLERAAEALRSGGQPVKRIADSVGIPDVLYFTRLFSRRFKTGPAAYRRQHQELL
jgi:AraC-like DNA-binding protein